MRKGLFLLLLTISTVAILGTLVVAIAPSPPNPQSPADAANRERDLIIAEVVELAATRTASDDPPNCGFRCEGSDQIAEEYPSDIAIASAVLEDSHADQHDQVLARVFERLEEVGYEFVCESYETPNVLSSFFVRERETFAVRVTAGSTDDSVVGVLAINVIATNDLQRQLPEPEIRASAPANRCLESAGA